MPKKTSFGTVNQKTTKKKTRQGNSVNTKYGTKTSKKYYVKKYRGQGK